MHCMCLLEMIHSIDFTETIRVAGDCYPALVEGETLTHDSILDAVCKLTSLNEENMLDDGECGLLIL